MVAIPRYRSGPAILSAGFRPFFLAAALWAAAGIPIWLAAYADGFLLPSRLDPLLWHVHEMVFGFAAATVAGFLLTAIPNWTGRVPLQGRPLALLVGLWAAGRIGVLSSGAIGAPPPTSEIRPWRFWTLAPDAPQRAKRQIGERRGCALLPTTLESLYGAT